MSTVLVTFCRKLLPRRNNRTTAGPYFIGVASGRQPSLMMRANNPLANAYERHFENIWIQHSRPAQSVRSWRNFFLKSRSEEHTSELQSRSDLVCRLLLEK